MGWIGWTVLTLVLLGLLGAIAIRHALKTNAVAVLGATDRVLRGGDGNIRRVAATRFGPDREQRLEMFLPANAKGPLPVVVFIHGGSWASGDPRDYRFIARALAPKGYAVVLAGYRLFPKVRFPAMLEDGAGALRWVHDHAASHGGDPSRTVLMGHSAGAYNALMLTLDRQWLAHRGLSADALRGTVALAPPADFFPFDTQASIDSFGQALDPRLTQPITFARGDAPPLLLVTGDADTRVKPRNSITLAHLLTKAGTPTEPVLLKDVTHEGIITKLARPFDRDARVLDAVLPFLARVTASPAVQAAAR